MEKYCRYGTGYRCAEKESGYIKFCERVILKLQGRKSVYDWSDYAVGVLNHRKTNEDNFET